MAPWHRATMAPCHCGTIAPCHHVTVAPCHHDTMAQCHHGTLSPWYHGTVSPWHHGTVSPWHHGTVAPWHHGTVAPWHHGTVSPWHRGTFTPLQHGTIAPWPGAWPVTPHRGGTYRSHSAGGGRPPRWERRLQWAGIGMLGRVRCVAVTGEVDHFPPCSLRPGSRLQGSWGTGAIGAAGGGGRYGGDPSHAPGWGLSPALGRREPTKTPWTQQGRGISVSQ
jgi:hypothetical protein